MAIRPAEREYIERTQDRKILGDEEFFDEYYFQSKVTLNTCSRVLEVLRTQLNMANPRPQDNVAYIYDDIDISEVCYEIGDEFNIKFPYDVIANLEGTVDSLVRATEALRNSS